MKRLPVIALFIFFSLGSVLPAQAGWKKPAEKDAGFEWFPGSARAVSHSLSASQDTAILGFAVTPYVKLSGGGDFAFFRVRLGDYSLRPGMFGMATLEGWESYELSDGLAGLLIPELGNSHYRGLLGVSASVEFEKLAEKLIGGRGVLEAVLSFRHESESYTTKRWGMDPAFVTVPNIGQCIILEAAARVPVRRVDLEFRAQNKFFVGFGERPAYRFGPGADLIARWRLLKWLHPFTSTFVEYLFGNERGFEKMVVRIPDNYFIRNLTGVIFHSDAADVQLFLSFRVGHGKGLLAFREEFIFGGGVRLAVF